MGKTLSLPSTRPPSALTPGETDLSAASIDAFAIAIGGRQQLLTTLAVASGAPEIDAVHRLLLDPRYAGWTLRRICTLAGLTVADLFVAYKKALVVKAHLEATKIVADNLVSVVADVMARAQPQRVPCPTCGGTLRYVPAPTKTSPSPEAIPCPTCRETPGYSVALPDLDRQKVALELGQLITSRAGITVQQNSLTVAPGGSVSAPGALEALQQVVQATLYPQARPADPAPPIDAEILPDADPDPGDDPDGASAPA